MDPDQYFQLLTRLGLLNEEEMHSLMRPQDQTIDRGFGGQPPWKPKDAYPLPMRCIFRFDPRQ